MKLHRITIENFRGVERFELSFALDGVTIVEGDNEIGKSCVPEALQLVLGTLDSAKSKNVKAIKPVHRDAAPEVEVEISSGPYEFVLRKRWLIQASTTLTVTSPRREQLTGREAHDRVQAILEETLDHDLWNALNVEQGGDLTLPIFNVPALGRALDAAAGGAISSVSDDDLWGRIVAEYDRYWTATGRPKSDRITLGDRVTTAKALVESVHADIDLVEADVIEVERLESALPVLRAQLDECRTTEIGLDARWSAAQLATADLRAAQATSDGAELLRDRAAERHDARQQLIAEHDRVASTVQLIADRQAKGAPIEAAVRERSDCARLAIEHARCEHETAETLHRLAVADTTHQRHLIEVAQFTERLDQVRAAEARLLGADAVIGRNELTQALVAEIEGHHLDAVRADAALDRGATIVRTEALGLAPVRIDGTDVELVEGEVREAHVVDGFLLEVPGTLRLTITPGSDSQQLATDAARFNDLYAEACLRAGVIGVAEARIALTERQSAEKDADSARELIALALRDLTPDALESKITSITAGIGEYEANRADEPALPADHDDAQAIERAAAKALALRVDELGALEAERSVIEQELRELDLEAATAYATFVAARQELLALEARLTDARGISDDATLAHNLLQAEESLETASDALETATQQVANHDPDLLSDLIANAAAATGRLTADIRANEQGQTEARARLAIRGEEGLQHKLNDAETQLQFLEREYESLELRANAASLLHNVAAECREDIRRRYHEPFRQQIERLGAILLGHTFEVELDQDLRIARRTVDGVTLDFEQLSAGAREQLGIVSRLACATIVSAHGGAPVVLDDTLGWTDPTRLAAMGAIIGVAGRDCQVIVLTCTPGRYASIGSAEIVRLSAGASVASGQLVDA